MRIQKLCVLFKPAPRALRMPLKQGAPFLSLTGALEIAPVVPPRVVLLPLRVVVVVRRAHEEEPAVAFPHEDLALAAALPDGVHGGGGALLPQNSHH